MIKSSDKMTSAGRVQRIWPQEEIPCIWMQAGIVSFKLCNRSLACETCPFDAIMRSGSGPMSASAVTDAADSPREPAEATPPASGESMRSPDAGELYFDPEACYGAGFWYLAPVTEHMVEMGISEIGAKYLPSLKEVIMPRPGAHLNANHTHFWLISAEGAIGLSSPFSGTVAHVNPHVLSHLATPNRAAASRLWFIELEVESTPQILKGLLQGENAADYLRSQHREILDTLQEALLDTASSPAQRSMQDGGHYLFPCEELLGARRYFHLLARYFRA